MLVMYVGPMIRLHIFIDECRYSMCIALYAVV